MYNNIIYIIYCDTVIYLVIVVVPCKMRHLCGDGAISEAQDLGAPQCVVKWQCNNQFNIGNGKGLKEELASPFFWHHDSFLTKLLNIRN